MNSNTIIFICICGFAFLFLVYESYMSGKRKKERLKKRIREQWGKQSDSEVEYEELDRLTYYFNRTVNENKDYIDDITWNDTNMDEIFSRINTTNSAMGEEYLYKTLRFPEKSIEKLEERNKIISLFQNDKEKAFKFSEIFAQLGRTKRISLLEFVDRLDKLEIKSNLLHYVLTFLIICSIGLLFVMPVYGIIALIVMLCINIGSYYPKKGEVENYFICMRYIVAMQNASDMVLKTNEKELEEYCERLKEINKILVPIRKGVFWLAPKKLDGSVSEIFLEYIRMITHADLIKFNNMLKHTNKYKAEIVEMFEILGMIDSMIAVASYRESLNNYTIPDFSEKHSGIKAKDVYHPLVEEPVTNSIDEEKCVLLTGSNASGKSTFLKTIAINAIFAQTIYTCLASEFKTSFYDIYSSMALKDNILGNESYYIVEIKSLKRILDRVNEGKNVLCFVDEVLRGTNTVERIAASSMILKNICIAGATSYAATHDIELTDILEKYYSNYHFQEDVSNDDVVFNYKLNKGRATSRNAIKLLNVIGYDKTITEEAEKYAKTFIEFGKWERI